MDRIIELENSLNSLVDSELRHELNKYSGFEVLNSEKITPFFLSLAKGSQIEAKMDDIRDERGAAFESTAERKQFIREFYANIYRKDPREPADLEGCIERFLGQDICANPIVTNSKIPADIRDRLDAPLTIFELDVSISEANKSASGMDGMSNCFIKKFWRFFRVPLHRYARCVLIKKKLTPTFRSGLLKLIPKKGDTSRITNWRPISLLSCMYKILSRALNTRLKLARDFIFSRAQKGFTNSRFIQEVLINLCETIGYCNQNNIPACIVAIDQAKAFDTISNAYMLQVYRFFGMGEYMINLLTTLGSGRVACISFDDGSVSDPFDLERGRTQGNGPSPCEYNIGQQILLFKLELCPDLASVYNHLLVPRTVMSTVGATHPSITDCIESEANPRFSQESNRETDKAEGFADDTSVATIFSHNNLLHLKNMLEEFAGISGLRCNLDKTSVLLIGSSLNIPDNIAALGFTFSDKVKVLGMDISRNPEDWNQNFSRILGGINKKIEFWNRFNLSLPGRICVTKSLLISPLTHLGCVKLPSKRLLRDTQAAVDKFCKGKINFSAARMVVPVEEGGMGLFNIEEFLMAQQCCWVFRSFKSCRDNWRIDLHELSLGNPLSFSPLIIDSRRHPILYDIAVSYERFRNKFN